VGEVPIYQLGRPSNFESYLALEYAPVYTAPESVLPDGMMQNPNVTLTFAGQDDPDSYGRVINWTNAEDALKFRLGGHGLLPDPGLQVLEIQRTIWGFLVAFCKRMLHDIGT
jgi:hypothetical protein